MTALLDTTPPAAARAKPVQPVTEQRLALAKRRALRTLERRGVWRYSPRCSLCRGRIDIVVDDYDDHGHITRSRGQCRTPGCITWEK